MLFHSKLKSLLDRALSETGKERKTGDVKYHCKKCNHHKAKLEVNIDSGDFHCWVCHFRGTNVLDLLKGSKSNKTYVDEAKSILKEAGKQIKDWDNVLKKQEDHSSDTLSLPADFVPLSSFEKTRLWKRCFDYAVKRNFTTFDILKHNMGYVKGGQLVDRLIIPSYDREGILNHYTARSYFDDAYLKYINAEVQNRDLVGFELLIDFNQPINLVEGGFDAVTLGYNTIPLFGKNVSNLLKKRIIQYNTPEIRIILDDDALNEAMQICEMFIRMGKKVKLVKLDGKDPNKLGRYKTQEIISNTKLLTFSDIIKHRIK